MGVKLFVRGTRKISLTNEGILLRRRAEEILELVDKTERELTEQKDYVTPEDLAGVPLILPRRLNVQSELASWFGGYYEKLQVLFTSNLPSNSAVMVHGGLACALVIQGSLDFCDQEKLIGHKKKIMLEKHD